MATAKEQVLGGSWLLIVALTLFCMNFCKVLDLLLPS